MSSDLRIQPAIDNGDLPSDWQICNTCRGNGHHKRIDQRVLEGWGETSYIYEDCEDCKSTGKIDLSKKKYNALNEANSVMIEELKSVDEIMPIIQKCLGDTYTEEDKNKVVSFVNDYLDTA